MSDGELPPRLVEGLLRLCQGDYAFRLPRTMRRDEEDTIAFFVNSIAEELSTIVTRSRAQEQKLEQLVERLSKALLAVASGDFGVQVTRDFSGDPADVLAFLVNNTVTELGAFVAVSQRRAEEDRVRLEALVAERTAELERQAITDALTGLLNRRRIFDLATREHARAQRHGPPLVFAMLDIDHFKAINDRFGHTVGDEALLRVAASLRWEIRTTDCLGRYGGEEFLLVLPDTPLERAGGVLERIRAAVEATVLEADGERVPLTLSAGAAALRPGEGLDLVIRRADDALYRAKDHGRNRVVLDEVEP